MALFGRYHDVIAEASNFLPRALDYRPELRLTANH